MGAWGYKYYENDTAADWFGDFWDTKDMQLVTRTVENYDAGDDVSYDEIRAAAHILISFHSVYTQPASFENYDEIATKTLEILRSMIDPANKECFFLEEWDHAEEAVADVQLQIKQLEKLLAS